MYLCALHSINPIHLKPHLRYFLLFFVLSAGIFSQIQAQPWQPPPGWDPESLNRRPHNPNNPPGNFLGLWADRYVVSSIGNSVKAIDPTTPGTDTVFVTTVINEHTGAVRVDTIAGTARYLIEFTVGEILVEFLHGSKKRLSQGLHQHFPLIPKNIFNSPAVNQEGIRERFAVFPNPFVSNISVNWDFEEEANLLFEIYSLDGRRMFSHHQNSASSQLLIQLNNLKPQTYILRVSDPSKGFLETHRIVKL